MFFASTAHIVIVRSAVPCCHILKWQRKKRNFCKLDLKHIKGCPIECCCCHKKKFQKSECMLRQLLSWFLLLPKFRFVSFRLSLLCFVVSGHKASMNICTYAYRIVVGRQYALTNLKNTAYLPSHSFMYKHIYSFMWHVCMALCRVQSVVPWYQCIVLWRRPSWNNRIFYVWCWTWSVASSSSSFIGLCKIFQGFSLLFRAAAATPAWGFLLFAFGQHRICALIRALVVLFGIGSWLFKLRRRWIANILHT